MEMPGLLLKSVSSDTPFPPTDADRESSISVSKIASECASWSTFELKTSLKHTFNFRLFTLLIFNTLKYAYDGDLCPLQATNEMWQKLKHFRTHQQYTIALIYLTRQRFFFLVFHSLLRCQLDEMNGFHFRCTRMTQFESMAMHDIFKLYTMRISLVSMLKTWIVAFVSSRLLRRCRFRNDLIADLRWICRRFECVRLFAPRTWCGADCIKAAIITTMKEWKKSTKYKNTFADDVANGKIIIG